MEQIARRLKTGAVSTDFLRRKKVVVLNMPSGVYSQVSPKVFRLGRKSSGRWRWELLLNEDEMEKAEDILDLAMEKMPVDDFGYYSLLEPYVLGYYELDKRDKARNLYQQVVKIYQEKLLYYSGMKVKRQFMIADEIISDMEKYRGLVDILIVMDEESFARPEANKFNDYLKLFRHFYSEEEGMDMDEDLPTDREIENALDLPIDTVVQDNTDVEPEL